MEQDEIPNLSGEDAYPALEDVLVFISENPDIPESGVTLLEICCFASGDATYRLWVRGQEEEIGGYWDGS